MPEQIGSSEGAVALSTWVLEGKLDLPIYFPKVEERPTVSGLYLDFSGGTGDGLIELQAEDVSRANESVWWSLHEPVTFKYRAAVRAETMPIAWERSYDFLEQMLDRLTVLAGAPARLLEAGMVYNESQLEDCRKELRGEFECTTHGLFTFRTQPFANFHIAANLNPSDRAKRALRWFRKGLQYHSIEDRFLAFYFALECISNDIKETEVKSHVCQSCGQSTGLPKSQTDGIKALIERHPEAPDKLFKELGRTRAKLVHGGDTTLKDTLRQLEPIACTLAAEGIMLSLDVDPLTARLPRSNSIDIYPIMTANYDSQHDPAIPWKRSMTELITLSAAHCKAAGESTSV